MTSLWAAITEATRHLAPRLMSAATLGDPADRGQGAVRQFINTEPGDSPSRGRVEAGAGSSGTQADSQAEPHYKYSKVWGNDQAGWRAWICLGRFKVGHDCRRSRCAAPEEGLRDRGGGRAEHLEIPRGSWRPRCLSRVDEHIDLEGGRGGGVSVTSRPGMPSMSARGS